MYHQVFSSQQKAEVVDYCKLQTQMYSVHTVQLEYAGMVHNSFQPVKQSHQSIITMVKNYYEKPILSKYILHCHAYE